MTWSAGNHVMSQ
uniref:Uncharacterized protein n=1 Tax=Anguilla anguilla TaxID=7936 RepID=A0A0E9VXP2_ANGAN